MKAILYITASPRGAESWSRRIGDAWADWLGTHHRAAMLIRRDLAADGPPAIAPVFANAILRPAEEWSAAERDALAYSERMIGELEAADLVVIATPMHNYTVPATLKTWIDHVVRIRRTFVSTPSGKVGLLRDRPTCLITAAGGYHSGAAARQPDFLVPYLRAVLATIGILDLRVLSLEGVTRGAEAASRAQAQAEALLDDWTAACS
jgi:FMN-dependent NADH-azoreductase